MTGQELTDRDRAHLQLMLARLPGQHIKKQDFGNHIYDVEALMKLLDSPSDEFITEIHDHWAVLEEVYAVTLYRNRDEFSETDLALIRLHVDAISILIEHALGACPSRS